MRSRPPTKPSVLREEIGGGHWTHENSPAAAVHLDRRWRRLLKQVNQPTMSLPGGVAQAK